MVGEARRLRAALCDWRLALLLGTFAALLLLASQAPLRYAINVGQEDGFGSDLPLLNGFFPPERDSHGDFRWTSERAYIQLPGVGQRPLQFTFQVFPIGPEVAERGPRQIEVWNGGRLVALLPVRPAGATYRLLLPPPPGLSGDHLVELRSATFVPAGDQRSIGSPVNSVSIVGLAGPALPAWRSTLGWLVAAALAWLALRRAGFGATQALALLLPAVFLASLAALLDPPRFAVGTSPALIALGLGYLLVLLLDAEADALLLAGLEIVLVSGVWAIGWGMAQADASIALPGMLAAVAIALLLAGWLRPALAACYHRLASPIPQQAWRWLLLFAWLVLALRFGGKIYPDSMRGDIGFHSNRYDLLVGGWVLQLSLNRGVSFPYPTAFYLLLAPFSLLGLPQRILLRLGAALLDALSPLLVYAITARISGMPRRPGLSPPRFDGPLVAAALYAFSAAGFMTTWWNFSTHIFTQFAQLLLIAALVLLPYQESGVRSQESEDAGSAIHGSRFSGSAVLSLLVVLQSLIYLGHFGFWMNMSLLGSIGLAALLLAAWRGRASWHTFRLALLAFVAAEALAALLFYSSFADLFLAQIQATAAGGLTGLAGRAPVDRAILWRTLWDAGFNIHFGFFPLPLAIIGLFLLARRTTTDHGLPTEDERHERDTRQEVTGNAGSRFSVLVLMGGTFAIGAIFAALPFLSGSTLSTRWLMFSAWAIAVGAALSLRLLWRFGPAGRLLTLAVGGYVVWTAASMWLMALAWRVRPPEPF